MRRKILITGAGGFIGSHLAERCVELGYDVRAFVHYNADNHWGWLEGSPVKNDLEVMAGDVRDYDAVSAAVKGREIIFHLAALIGIPYSYVSPLAYIRTNVEGTYNILQAARMEGAGQVLVTSTSETYGTAQYVPIDEKHPLNAQSPYAATKVAADQLALSFHRSFKTPVKIVRPFNTYGPRQSARAIIPTIITQLLSGDHQIRLGNLAPTRDLTFVRDTVEGFLAVAGSPQLIGEVSNVGMGTEISVGDLARKIAGLIGKPVEFIEDARRLRAAGSEVERLCCANAKIKQAAAWRPRYDLESGLTETIRWIEQNLGLYKAEIYNV